MNTNTNPLDTIATIRIARECEHKEPDIFVTVEQAGYELSPSGTAVAEFEEWMARAASDFYSRHSGDHSGYSPSTLDDGDVLLRVPRHKVAVLLALLLGQVPGDLSDGVPF